MLRAGIIGLGAWARVAHIPAVLGNPHLTLVAVADPSAESLQVAREMIPNVEAYQSGFELLDHADVDLVIVATPDDEHVPFVKRALERNLHVLCEKPLGISVEEARTVVDLAERTAVRTRVGFTLRYAPAVQRLREIVTNGEIGTVQHLQAFQQNGQFLDPATPFHWKMDAGRTGGGAIVEYGIHTLDLVRWIAGEIDQVAATSRIYTAGRTDGAGMVRTVDGDDSTAWMMQFANGATGIAHASWSTVGRGPGLELRVYGSTGAAKCVLSDDLPGSQGLWVADGNDGRFVELDVAGTTGSTLPWWQEFQTRLLAGFVTEIQDSAPPDAPFRDGLRAQELLEAVIRASREQSWIIVGAAMN